MPMDWEKWQQKREGHPQPPDMDKVVENLKRFRGRMPSAYIIVAILVAVWLVSGIYIVAPDEQGIVKRFGAYNRTTDPGPHYHWPYPMESVIKPKVTIVRRIEVGFRTIDQGPPPNLRPIINESLMLTGDENIIDLWFIVQYRVSDPHKYLFNVAEPAKTLTDAAEAAMRGVMGDSKIDEALTAGKFEIQNDAQASLQKILDRYESGLTVVAVQLQAVHPPEQVRDAFRDVVSAREEKNQTINEAQGYANDILPKAKGQAAQLERQAEGYKQEKVERAFGDASRFLAQLEEYRKAKEVTRQRLYLETLESVLPEARKFVFDPEVQKILPLLPLQGLEPSKPAAE